MADGYQEGSESMTAGEWMFYGGIACFLLCLVGLVITKAALHARGKKLRSRFDEEYGETRR